jgi:phenylpropionate dioxygenase-like ring-hydroxylating dioxygenase large terminal subunit
MGQVRAVEAFGGRLAVFRGADGRCGALDARCAHLGADLAKGRVGGLGLSCPLHERCFAADGRRLDRGPDATRGQRAYATQERFGIIFAFRGGGDAEPTFPLPEPSGIAQGIHTRVQVTDGQVPLIAIGANAFDTLHLLPVHGRAVVGEPLVEVLSRESIRITYVAGVAGHSLKDRFFRLIGADQVTLEIESHGGSLLIFHHRRVASYTVYAVVPVAAQQVRIFMVSGRARAHGLIGRGLGRLQLAAHQLAANSIHRQDARAVGFTAPGPIHLDPLSDSTLALWLEHFHALPCSDGPA